MKANLWTGMLAGMLLGGLFVLVVARPYEKALAQESSSSLQSSLTMGQGASDQDIDLMLTGDLYNLYCFGLLCHDRRRQHCDKR